MDRQSTLLSWVTNILDDDDCTIQPASSDASFRSYWRVISKNRSFIIMDAPPEHENCIPFINIAKTLALTEVNVPEVIAQDLELGFLLLSDLGPIQYLSALNNENYKSLYADAMDALHNIQQKACCDHLPHYDAVLLKQELNLFDDWFIGKHLEITLTEKRFEIINQCYDLLIANALEQPQTFVHRDYHSRNLMKTQNNNPGILDFQDAVIGPITYDLVSLLRDCYITWDEDSINSISNDFLHKYNTLNDSNISLEQWQKWFDLMGVQRHLKAIGIFCRLNYRDNKPNYLKDINRTFCYVKNICKRHQELHPFYNLLTEITPSMSALCAP